MHCCQMFLFMGRVVDKFETKGGTFVRTFIPRAGRFHGEGKETVALCKLEYFQSDSNLCPILYIRIKINVVHSLNEQYNRIK